MSRIYFHTEDQAVEVLGSERALLGQTCGAIAAGGFALLDHVRESVIANM